MGSRHGLLRGTRLAVAVFVAAGLLAVPAVAHAATSPHGAYDPTVSTGTDKCSQCHAPHVASLAQGLLSREPTTTAVTQSDLCFDCHGYSGPALSNALASFDEGTFPSGHVVEDATGTVTPDLTNVCTGCHDAHSEIPGLPGEIINGQEVTRTPQPDDPNLRNSWCFACHTPEIDPNWSGLVGFAYYDKLFDMTSRDASGYPTLGTFRGKTAYLNTSAHSSIPASPTAGRIEGDCLWCHASHRGESEYDNLLGTFGATSPTDKGAGVCFECHDEAEGYGSGHFIRSTTAWLEDGSPLPCYECHNAHGSMNGNTKLIQDSLGADLDPFSDDGGLTTAQKNELTARFCFTCHLSSDDYWWDSESATMRPLSELASAEASITKVIAGIDRADMITLPNHITQHASTNLEGCSCHGSVHAPNPDGVSSGGLACYGCHGELEDDMEWDAGGVAPYGHAVGTSSRNGDTAAYPDYGTDSKSNVYCLSCHMDHTFNSDKGLNLRTSVDAAATATRTDHAEGTANGVCVTCHSIDVGTVTYNVSGADYQNAAHDYDVNDATLVGYDGTSAFRPNCTKCHTDPVGLDGRQDGTYKVAPHFSDDESRLAKALGATITGTSSTEENLCFACHDSASTGNDGYGVQAMGSAARNVEYYFTTTDAGYSTYRHNVVGYSDVHVTDENQTDINTNGEHIECEDCHNPHTLGDNTLNSTNHSTGTNAIGSASPIAGVTGIEVAFGVEWATPGSGDYSEVTADKEHEICFKCHSGANTNLTSWNAAWTNVALEFNPANDSFHPVTAALPAVDLGANNGSSQLPNANRLGGNWTAGRGQTMYCSDCHGDSAASPRAQGPHGSAATYMLKGPNSVWPGSNGQFYLGGTNTGLFCLNCHPNLNSATSGNSNGVHTRGSHRNSSDGICTACHITVPHGGKVSRLIVDRDTTPAPYLGYNAAIRSFRKDPAGTYNNAANYCYASCQHTGIQNYEDWND